jgi:hypothetical protein
MSLLLSYEQSKLGSNLSANIDKKIESPKLSSTFLQKYGLRWEEE